jgi:hypothetical protein
MCWLRMTIGPVGNYDIPLFCGSRSFSRGGKGIGHTIDNRDIVTIAPASTVILILTAR